MVKGNSSPSRKNGTTSTEANDLKSVAAPSARYHRAKRGVDCIYKLFTILD